MEWMVKELQATWLPVVIVGLCLCFNMLSVTLLDIIFLTGSWKNKSPAVFAVTKTCII